ncbi:MAG TPA: hypothetical protein VE109_06045 [Acidobacteriaceae bacterium]|nr:hypothetical protein [Acidobacteriaceae bacterium]
MARCVSESSKSPEVLASSARTAWIFDDDTDAFLSPSDGTAWRGGWMRTWPRWGSSLEDGEAVGGDAAYHRLLVGRAYKLECPSAVKA